jgi:hypothetical protein
MKSNELKELIRTVIQEELKKTLPLLIPQVLSEVLSGKSSNNSMINGDFPAVKTSDTEKQIEKNVQKQYKKYTNNDLLNKVLNETVGGVPQEGSYVSSMMNSFSAPSPAVINESVSQPLVATTSEQSKVLNLMNRDFRSLMKAVDNKKKNGGFNGSGLVQSQ